MFKVKGSSFKTCSEQFLLLWSGFVVVVISVIVLTGLPSCSKKLFFKNEQWTNTKNVENFNCTRNIKSLSLSSFHFLTATNCLYTYIESFFKLFINTCLEVATWGNMVASLSQMLTNNPLPKSLVATSRRKCKWRFRRQLLILCPPQEWNKPISCWCAILGKPHIVWCTK